MMADMHRKIYRSIQIIITEGWTVVWGEGTPPAAPEPDSHRIVWEEGQPGPRSIILRRQPDGLGWTVATTAEDTES